MQPSSRGGGRGIPCAVFDLSDREQHTEHPSPVRWVAVSGVVGVVGWDEVLAAVDGREVPPLVGDEVVAAAADPSEAAQRGALGGGPAVDVVDLQVVVGAA